MAKRYLIVGAGFSGSVLAYQLKENSDCFIDIQDERSHIGGNCHTSRDPDTGIMVHQYGPHIFNTDNKEIWDFVGRFVTLRPYVHRVKAMSNGKIYSLPVNLHTINQFFNKSFTPDEAKIFLRSLADKRILEPKNFEEQAIHFIGRQLYEAFFYGYTKKQWGCEPIELPASILKRIPVRFNYDDNYHNNYYTGIPEEGYSSFVEKLLAREGIAVSLNRKFHSTDDTSVYDHVFYTGPIDAYFDHKYGRLGYRTVVFEKQIRDGDFQGVSQMNYCDADIPFTRITEHKHFAYWEKHDRTITFREFSRETGIEDIPYYPKRLEKDKALLMKYRKDAEELKNVSFLGRLATYRYMDMQHVVGEALDFSRQFLAAQNTLEKLPVFSNTEN